jgi:hypothetical protein
MTGIGASGRPGAAREPAAVAPEGAPGAAHSALETPCTSASTGVALSAARSKASSTGRTRDRRTRNAPFIWESWACEIATAVAGIGYDERYTASFDQSADLAGLRSRSDRPSSRRHQNGSPESPPSQATDTMETMARSGKPQRRAAVQPNKPRRPAPHRASSSPAGLMSRAGNQMASSVCSKAPFGSGSSAPALHKAATASDVAGTPRASPAPTTMSGVERAFERVTSRLPFMARQTYRDGPAAKLRSRAPRA